MPNRAFTAEATKDGKWWMVHVDGIDHLTQARSIGEVDEMAHGLVAAAFDLDPDEVEVTVVVRAPADAESRWEAAKADLAAARELSKRGAAAARAVVSDLRQEYTLKEVARILGIAYQRVQQLAGPKMKEGHQ